MTEIRENKGVFNIFFILSTIGKLLLLCQLVVGFSGEGFALEKQNLKSRIELLLKDPQLKKVKIGLKVVSLSSKEVLFSHQESKVLKPASNVKLVTTLAALKYLGSEYRFKTKVFIDGPIQNGILKGNLSIRGFGDPKLVSEQLWFLTNELKRVGFHHVQGNLILDESYFDKKRKVRNGGRSGHRAYDAPLGALSVNFNTTTVYVLPNNKVGKKARVTIDPNHDYIKVINRSKTVSKNARRTLRVTRKPKKTYDVIEVTGNIPLLSSEKRFYRNITHPLHYAAAMFRRFFKEQGISVQGKDLFSPVPSKAKEVLVYESRPLRTLVGDLNKISNNFVAEQILKTLSAELKQPPGTTDKGLHVLGEFLRGIGIKSSYQLVNGSGLSYDNRMSAAQLVEVLKYGYSDFKLFPEYLASMGIVGVDGTVEHRLKGTLAEGRVRAKTGSLKGVSALSGYVSTSLDEPLAFSMLMNDPKDRDHLMQNLQDKILMLLCELK